MAFDYSHSKPDARNVLILPHLVQEARLSPSPFVGEGWDGGQVETLAIMVTKISHRPPPSLPERDN